MNENSDLKLELERTLIDLHDADRLISIDPKNEFYHFLKSYELLVIILTRSDIIGAEEFREGLKEALEEINIATALNPKNKIFHYYKGHIFFMLNKYEEALEEYNKVLLIDPNDKEVRRYKIEILMLMQKYEDVLKEFNKMIENDPDDKEAHFSKAIYFKKLNWFKESLNEYRKAILIDYYKVLDKLFSDAGIKKKKNKN